ncbi:MAG: succinate dehydrogenase cytochrome b subunit [Muribaculaceae bacterium]|nr:succinate dehydrogenase cytochrome b subunit [Muribaculaceae bacterium]
MWLTSSSIGRKFVMAITGACLVLFVTFHVLMNSVALLWPAAYNQVCEFLGANWYALVCSAGLALLFIIHIIYALWLTIQNRRARGNDRYAVNGSVPEVKWQSKNMLVLGIVVLAFLAVHLVQFWAKMQLQELISHDLKVLPQIDGVPAAPALGTLFIQLAFQTWWTPVVYIIGFIALWFHMNHGFWSMFHTVGWDNGIWIKRIKTISLWWTSVVIALFIAQAIVFTVNAHNNYYLTNEGLQEQYGEYWNAQAEKMMNELNSDFMSVQSTQNEEAISAFFLEKGEAYAELGQLILDSASKQAPEYASPALQGLGQAVQFLNHNVGIAKSRAAQMNHAAAQAENTAADAVANEENTNE